MLAQPTISPARKRQCIRKPVPETPAITLPDQAAYVEMFIQLSIRQIYNLDEIRLGPIPPGFSPSFVHRRRPPPQPTTSP
jgi:hypothetical protein